MNRTICGADVSRDWLDADVRPGEVCGGSARDVAGVADLLAPCRQYDVELTVMEASASLWAMAPLPEAAGPSMAMTKARVSSG